MWNNVSNFISENQTSLLTNLIVGLLFFILGPVIVNFSNRKIRIEKINRAKDSFLDILENMLVNGEAIKKEKLSSLFNAISREHSVNMESATDLTNLLEDLGLRFSKSKHLSAQQKDEYANKIETVVDSIENPEPAEKKVPRSYRKIFEEIDSILPLNDSQQLQIKIEELKDKVSDTENVRPTLFITSRLREKFRENPLAFTIATFVALLLYFFLFYSVTKGLTFLKP